MYLLININIITPATSRITEIIVMAVGLFFSQPRTKYIKIVTIITESVIIFLTFIFTPFLRDYCSSVFCLVLRLMEKILER